MERRHKTSVGIRNNLCVSWYIAERLTFLACPPRPLTLINRSFVKNSDGHAEIKKLKYVSPTLRHTNHKVTDMTSLAALAQTTFTNIAVKNLFPTPLVIADLPVEKSASLNAALVTTILRRYARSP